MILIAAVVVRTVALVVILDETAVRYHQQWFRLRDLAHDGL